MATTKTKKTRLVGWVKRLSPGIGTIRIVVGGKEDRYDIQRCESDWGRAYVLSKHGGNSYDLNTAKDTPWCDCIAFAKSSTCRHIEAVRAMEERGMIS